MTCTKWIQAIRNDRTLSTAYEKLSLEGRKRLYNECDGDLWHILEIMQEIEEDEKMHVSRDSQKGLALLCLFLIIGLFLVIVFRPIH